jgi:hypothetical protein
MDTNTLIFLVVVLFAVLVLAAILIFPRVKANLKGPAGIGLDLDASNDKQPSQPGVQIKGAKAKSGSVQATDETGHGVTLDNVQAGKDIKATNKQPQKDGHPKAKR